jgi:hypothetical protein
MGISVATSRATKANQIAPGTNRNIQSVREVRDLGTRLISALLESHRSLVP